MDALSRGCSILVAVLAEIRNAVARERPRDDVRADQLMASRRLAVPLHQDRPRRAAAAHEPALR